MKGNPFLKMADWPTLDGNGKISIENDRVIATYSYEGREYVNEEFRETSIMESYRGAAMELRVAQEVVVTKALDREGAGENPSHRTGISPTHKSTTEIQSLGNPFHRMGSWPTLDGNGKIDFKEGCVVATYKGREIFSEKFRGTSLQSYTRAAQALAQIQEIYEEAYEEGHKKACEEAYKLSVIWERIKCIFSVTKSSRLPN